MRLWCLSLVFLVSFLAPAALPASADVCGFQLGFATLHDLIPGKVGDCLDNEQHNPDNGDALQHSTGGLLVWRKADNWTAFTDGYHTWINGPYGLQMRLNSQRFSWEAGSADFPLADTAFPPGVERCHTAGLTVDLVGTDAGAGQRYTTLRFTNTTSRPCGFYGYPGFLLLNGLGQPLPTHVRWEANLVPDSTGPQIVVVQPFGSAFVVFHWSVIPVGAETSCPLASRLEVTPPDETTFLVLSMQLAPCGGGFISVSPVRPRPFP